MIVFAVKMLVGDRLKYLGLVLGLAFASLLITQQASIDRKSTRLNSSHRT